MSIASYEMDAIRDHVEALILTRTAVISRSQGTVNDYGLYIDVFGPVGTVSCSVAKQIRRLEQGEGAQRELETAYYAISLPWDTDVEPDDRLNVDGIDYSIDTLWKNHSFRSLVRVRGTVVDT